MNMKNDGPFDDEAPPVDGSAMVRVDSPVQVSGVQGGNSVDAARIAMEVQAQVISAHKFPRDENHSIEKIVGSCMRPALAEQALYKYARGGSNIVGPSIRLAEEIARCWGNIQYGWRVTAENRVDGWSDLEAFAWDVESGMRPSLTFRCRHWRDTKGGGYRLKDERDIYELCANMAARRVRKCILQVIPAMVQEEALNAVKRTLAGDGDAGRMASAVSNLTAYFKKLGVDQASLEKYLEHTLDKITADEVIDLRACATSIKDGERTPFEIFGSGDGDPSKTAAATGSKIGKGMAALAEAK